MRLDGKTAIVTGGASGFGEGIVRKFLHEGARVVIADINRDAAHALADELGADAIAISADVTDGRSVEQLRTATKESFDHIDIVVNNAGVTHLPAALDEVTEEDFDRVFQVNCKSVYLMAKTFIPALWAICIVADTVVAPFQFCARARPISLFEIFLKDVSDAKDSSWLSSSPTKPEPFIIAIVAGATPYLWQVASAFFANS